MEGPVSIAGGGRKENKDIDNSLLRMILSKISYSRGFCMLGKNEIYTGMKECQKCGHKWFPRNPEVKPVQCPRCKTYKWEKI